MKVLLKPTEFKRTIDLHDLCFCLGGLSCFYVNLEYCKMYRSHHQLNQLHYCTAMVITSPNSSKRANVNINVAPPLIDTAKSPPIVVVVGGVHLVKRNDKLQTLMSVSVSMDCQYANIATCRRFCEQVQNLLQIPELCDS